MTRTTETRRRFGTTLVVWGLTLGMLLVLPAIRGPVTSHSSANCFELDTIDVDWFVVFPTLTVLLTTGFLLRSPAVQGRREN